ncbi:ParA family protein [Lactobacillus johnsonii]|uniref:ParA family protein n=1 Tax=Lactobacillus johnsonii TaxID=33959 RepID=A0AAW5M4Z0_LACJH|nr:ParA family protein [Lactobacillus johnsonii]MCR1915435.1 ParA family protein [Lactobacillus johnsonii]TWU79309.1 Sporulation initiation inhibitor protein Soj [Lactobacillus johnsonii]
MTKIITFAAIKGGVGKTTLAYNFGSWLANRNRKILFIDFDHQCNLSQTYNIYDQKGSVGNILRPENEVIIQHVADNIDLIAGDMHLDDIETTIENKTNKNMMLYLWLYDNYEKSNISSYDYIIIDCHPDFSTATKNAIIVSDDILSPITPSEYGYKAKYNLQERIKELKEEAIDFTSHKSYVTANLYFVANMLKHNTTSSRELLESLRQEKEAGDDSCIAYVPYKELFNKSELNKISLSEMNKDHKLALQQRKFFTEIFQTFENIEKTL